MSSTPSPKRAAPKKASRPRPPTQAARPTEEARQEPAESDDLTEFNMRVAAYVLDNSFEIRFKKHGVSKKRKLDPESAQIAADALGVNDREALSLDKYLWPGSSPRLMRGMAQLLNEAERLVKHNRLSAGGDGAYVLPKGDIEGCRQYVLAAFDALTEDEKKEFSRLEDHGESILLERLGQTDFAKLARLSPATALTIQLEDVRRRLEVEVERFNAEDYQAAKDMAAELLADQYDEANYPSRLSCSFSYTIRPMKLSERDVSEVGTMAAKASIAKQQAEIAAIIEATKQQMFTAVQEALASLAEQMTGTGTDGQPKRLQSRSIEKVRKIMSDLTTIMEPIGGSCVRVRQLQEAVGRLLSGVDLEKLRQSNPDWQHAREEVARQTTALVSSLGGLLVPAASGVKRVTPNAELS